MGGADGQRPARSRAYNLLVAAGAVLLVALVAVAVVLVLRGSGGSGITHQARQPTVVTSARQVTVDVIDNDFRPADLTVAAGATVTWRFQGSLPHNVTETSGAFRSDTLSRGASYQRTFDAAGTFSYYCTIHHVMTGTVTVR